MKKSIFISVFLTCFISLSSIVYALSLRKIIPLDILSSFLNNILGTTSTTTVISVDTNKVISTNKLSLGFQLDWERPNYFIDPNRQVYRTLAKDANFKLVRVFDYRPTSSYGYKNIMPCTSWNANTKSCNSWDWSTVDALTDAIFSAGAEPLFCLGAAWVPISSRIPSGMPINSATGLPDPDEYAVYAAAWVSHFKQTGRPVRYYEILNEPYHWYDSPSPDPQKLKNVVAWWNAAAKAMRAINSQIRISNDALTQKEMLDYWVNYGDDVDSIDFHKYDTGTIGQYSDTAMFNRAESAMFENSSSWYGIDTARQIWYNKRGKWLPVINTEFNFNWNPDPNIQTMTGAVWTSLVLRKAMLKGLDYITYFEFSDGPNTGSELGMINYLNNKPWYPYYVQKIIGSNLAVGDSVVSSTSLSNVSSIAWIHSGKLNILLIHKSTGKSTISLQGVTGQLNYQKIDNTYSVDNAQVQTGTIDASSITLNGYTVMLLQSSTTPISTTTTKITTTISPTTIPPSQYAIGYWKFDEGSGTIAYDSSPFKNTATLYNNPVWVTGKFNQALQFSGNNYVETPDSSSLDLSSQVTITAWINPSSIGAYTRIVAKSHTSNANPWTMYGLLFDNANHIRLEIATNGQQNAVNGVTTIPLNTWTFVAGTYDGTTMKVYVNGNLDNSFSHTGAIDTDNMPLSIGRSGFNYDYFKGMIDEVKVWNRALTVDEIKSEYRVSTCSDGTAYGSCSATKPLYCSSGTLINGCGSPYNCVCPYGSTCQSDGSCKSNVVSDYKVTVDTGKTIATNKFRVGMKLDWEWKAWSDSSTLKQLTKDAGFAIINSYTAKSTSPRACTSWNNAAKNCNSWSWNNIDALLRNISSLGAEPMISISLYDMSSSYLPSGMLIDSATNLPQKDQFAAYAAAWVQHFKNVGIPIKYYEINEEGFEYFGWNGANGVTKIRYYIDVWNAAARAMRAVNPNIKISDDSITMTKVFDEWLVRGDNVDFLSFHKYDTNSLTDPDADLIARADTRCFETTSAGFYGVDEARQMWLGNRSKWLPVINHETNLNSHWGTSTNLERDPRMRKIIGSVWNALMLRESVLKGLDYSLYYSFASSDQTNYYVMVDITTGKKYFPYYVYKWIGNNLNLSDAIVNSTSDSANLKTLSWIDNGKLNILLIHKSNSTKTVSLQGISGTFDYWKIDDPNDANYNNPPTPSKLTLNEGDAITLNGYTVMLLQKTTPNPTSSSTTTTIPSGFTGTNFICNYVQTNNLWECSLDYTNNLNEKGLVKFYFIDSVSGGVKSIGSIWTNTGSGTVGSELSCDNYHGTYNVVWRAYRSSDSSRSNPVAFSASFKSITCS